MSEQFAESDAKAVEYGVRFLPPHRNAGEAVWLPDIAQVARMVLDSGMAEAVVRRVGPWERKPCTGHHEDLDCKGLCGLVPQHRIIPPENGALARALYLRDKRREGVMPHESWWDALPGHVRLRYQQDADALARVIPPAGGAS